MSSFCKCKSYSHFFSKNISVYAIFNDRSFHDTLTNDIVSFEQLGPDVLIFRVIMVFHPQASAAAVYLKNAGIFRTCWWKISLCQYSQLSLSQSPRNCLKCFQISAAWHIRFAEKINQTIRFNKCICNLTPEIRDILKILWKRGEIAQSNFSSF